MPAGNPAAGPFDGIPPARRAFMAGLLVWFATVGVGCDQTAPIVVERVPKDAPPAEVSDLPAARNDRMLAAIVPHQDQAWFFKVTGPDETVAGQKEGFVELLTSVRFEGGEPKWTLPEGWTQRPGSQMRFATIEIPAEPPLELAVSSLSLPKDDLPKYLLDNINRWRGQMGLDDVGADALAAGGEADDEIAELKLEDGSAVTLVDLAGSLQSGGMMPPFAGGRPSGLSGGAGTGRPAASPLAYDVPEGWEPLGADGISKASFSAAGGAVKITVTDLSASSNGLPENVNRWRDQVGLPPLGETQLEEETGTITLGDGGEGHLVTLTSPSGHEPPDAILGVIATRGETMWFVKLRGEPDAALGEKANFESFVKSLRFSESAN